MIHNLQQAFSTIVDDEEKEKITTICRGAIIERYLQHALKDCKLVGVGYHVNHIVAVVLAFTHTSTWPKTKTPICAPHELYLDVVCSYYCYRRCGVETLIRFMDYARQDHISVSSSMPQCEFKRFKALIIYATSGSQSVWRDRWGFQERDTFIDKHGICRQGPIKRKVHPDDPLSVRMTLILSTAQEKPNK